MGLFDSNDEASKYRLMSLKEQQAAQQNMDAMKAAQTADSASKAGTYTNAAAAAAPMVGAAIDPKQRGAGPVLSGAATGASIGTAVMPGVGTAVGAVIGAGLGLMKASKNRKDQAQQTAANIAEIRARGLNQASDALKGGVRFKFGTSGSSFSSRNKGF